MAGLMVEARTTKFTAERIFDTLADRLRRREIPAGERLTEIRLSKEFGVSRTPVRAALRRLEHEGYVEKNGPRGYAVCAGELTTIVHIYTVRAVLEELSVELAAAAVGTPAFETFHARVLEAVNKHDGELREAFHEDLAKLSGNPELVRMLQTIDNQIYAFRRLDAMISGRSEVAQREHAEMLDLLISGQTEEAKLAMRSHIHVSQSTVRSLLRAGVATISFGATAADGDAKSEGKGVAGSTERK